MTWLPGPYDKMRSLKQDEERAAIRLLAVTKLDMSSIVLEEVERRERLFAKTWPEHIYGHNETAKTAAFDSVYTDIVKGRL